MTPEILWKWQAGTTEEDLILAADIADDGTVILAGATSGDWTGTHAGGEDSVAVKLSADGVEEWRWQEGSDDTESVMDVAIGEDGSSFLIGFSGGDWGGSNVGDNDFVVAKIGSSGTTLWRWQDGTPSWDYLNSGAIRSDGSVIGVGHTSGNWSGQNSGYSDFAAVTLDEDGNELWRWMDGTSDCDDAMDVDIAQDGTVIICGCTHGSFGGSNAGLADMVVIKLSSDGDFMWAWQDGTSSNDFLMECTLGSDGSIYLAGYTTGNWSDINVGHEDFAAAKLDADGNEIWRWQGGTAESDVIATAAMTPDDSLFLAGYTDGDWSTDSAGSSDFAIVQLDTDGAVLWKWQDGNSDSNEIVAAASSGDKVIFGGAVEGDWEEDSAGNLDFAAILLESTGSDNTLNPTSSPAYSPTLSPSESSTLTQAPSPLISSMPIPGPSLTPSSMPIPGPSSTPSSMPIPGPSSTPSSMPIPGPSSTSSSMPIPGPSSTPSLMPIPGPSSTSSSMPIPGPSSTPSSMPFSEPSPTPSSMLIPGPSSTPSSTPTTTPIPTLFTSVSPESVPPTQASTETPALGGSGNTGSALSPSSPSPSSTSSSNDNAIIGGVVGAIIGGVILGLIIVLSRRTR